MTAPSSGSRNTRGRGFAGLRQGGDAAHLDQTAAKPQHALDGFGMLVEPRGDADRVRQRQPHRGHGQFRRRRRAGEGRREPERPDRQIMRFFGSSL